MHGTEKTIFAQYYAEFQTYTNKQIFPNSTEVRTHMTYFIRKYTYEIITKSDPSFMHLDISDKFYIFLVHENNTYTIV